MGIEYENYTLDKSFDDVDGQLFAISEFAIEEAREEARKIYWMLEKIYIGLTSDEAIEETLRVNGYVFLKSGKMFL